MSDDDATDSKTHTVCVIRTAEYVHTSRDVRNYNGIRHEPRYSVCVCMCVDLEWAER